MRQAPPIPGIRSIADVAERQLCAGCGACAAAEPERIRMVDDLAVGRRPIQTEPLPDDRALSICPGIALRHDRSAWDEGWSRDLADEWGPVLAVWEGHATDEELRHRGSSGGVTSALALHSLASTGAEAVVHSGPRPGQVLFNDAVRSTTREELLERAGSRYSPASPCEGLAPGAGPVAFVGKPCDVAGARALQEQGALRDTEVRLTIAIFCAGAPSTQATLDYLASEGSVEGEALEELRYRGHGWPGNFVARGRSGHQVESSYAASWAKLQAGRPWRCRICPDHTGEFADISVGDPWHTPPRPGEAGRSLVVARTARGLAAVEAAIAAGVVVLERVPERLLPASQEELRKTRRAVYGRVLAMRLARVPAPRFVGMALASTWRSSPLGELLRSLLGTLRRLRRYGLTRSRPVNPHPRTEVV